MRNSPLPTAPHVPLVNHLLRPRKKKNVKIKTSDGCIYRGEYYFREHITRIKDELDTTQELFVAVTGVKDEQGNASTYTFLFNINQVIYIAVIDDDYEENRSSVLEKEEEKRILSKRKAQAFIRTVDKKVLNGTIFIRNTLNRAKDELNTKDGKFLVMANVQEHGATPEDQQATYFINREYIVYVAVKDDTMPRSANHNGA